MTTEGDTTTVHAEDRPNRFALSAWLFLRAIALVHLIAFASTWTQLAGLVGPHGILPAQPFFNAVREQLGAQAYHALPSLCWIFGAGKFLPVLCAAGCALALLLFAGIAPAVCLFGLWACYLSLCCAGQAFFNFQWDALLLEATLAAVFLAPWSLLSLWRRTAPPRLARWLQWWLLFRLMFLSGVVKLTSGDPTWRDLSALTFHYETQPLPTPIGWFVHQLPAWFHRTSCAAMFVIELVAPFLFFAPRAYRHRAALLTIALMAVIALTGNYTFFNSASMMPSSAGSCLAAWRFPRAKLRRPPRGGRSGRFACLQPSRSSTPRLSPSLRLPSPPSFRASPIRSSNSSVPRAVSTPTGSSA
jgi:hypothetical protein